MSDDSGGAGSAGAGDKDETAKRQIDLSVEPALEPESTDMGEGSPPCMFGSGRVTNRNICHCHAQSGGDPENE
ncbi:MAG TPA: hypothetical protein VFJ82_04565 [Longimicrobium sp.]|nr:hypothetical protein [Longimicrobium sp.]